MFYAGTAHRTSLTSSFSAFHAHDELRRYFLGALSWPSDSVIVAKASSNTLPVSEQLSLHEQIRIPVPPIELQREFARRVRAVEKLKTAQRASLAELDALFASLQHRAFRGEL